MKAVVINLSTILRLSPKFLQLILIFQNRICNSIKMDLSLRTSWYPVFLLIVCVCTLLLSRSAASLNEKPLDLGAEEYDMHGVDGTCNTEDRQVTG